MTIEKPLPFQLTLNPKYKCCYDFCKHIEQHFSAEKSSMHIARNEIKKIRCSDYTLVVKSFKTPNLLNRLVYTYFRGSKADKAYNNALRLQELGINTPEPVAVIKELTPTLHKSYFISIAFEYDYTLREPLRNPVFKNRTALFEAFARYSANLHENGVLHNDYSQGNVLIKEENGEYTFSIVDINRMTFKTLSKEERFNNFSRLWADEKILKIIAKEYAKIVGFDVEETTREILKYDQKHKNFKQFKRLFKPQKK